MAARSLPGSPADLSAVWLTAVLRQSGAIRGAAVESFVVEEVGGVAGLIGVLVRVRLGYDRPEAGAPTTLIAKFPPVHGEELAPLGRIEARMYGEVIDPDLLPVPAVAYSGFDAGSRRCLVLMEDLAGYAVVRQIDGCTQEQASLAIRTLARFHAAWWESLRLDALGWLKPVRESFHGDSVGRFLREYRGEWNPAVAEIAPRLAAQYEALRDRISAGPRTIVHGDFHSQNLLFGTENGHRELAVIDFQMAAVGRGALDVARFLATSLQPEVRRAIEMDLLREYLAVLEAGGVRGYGMAECMDDVRAGLLWDLAARLVFVRGTERGPDGAWPPMPIAERCIEAIRDWEAERLLG